MLTHLAIGDAYGAGFEFAPADFVRAHNTLAGYVQHPTHDGVAPGRYTDDTQMSLAVAEHLIDHLTRGVPWDAIGLADRFVHAFHRDPRVGYARGFQAFLEGVHTGEAFLLCIRPWSDKNGAAMRAAPLAVLPDPAQVRDYAMLQASLTHDTPGGRDSAAAAALLVHYGLYRLGPPRAAADFLQAYVPGPWHAGWAGPVGTSGIGTVCAALAAVREGRTLSEVLWRAVAFQGDVDTVAALALAAGAAAGVSDDLPDALHAGLEAGPFGRTYLETVDATLMGLVAPGAPAARIDPATPPGSGAGEQAR